STQKARLIPFVLDPANGVAYAIEFGNGYARFHKNGALVTVAGVAAWDVATPYVVGDLVVQGGVNYYCSLANTGNAPPNPSFWYPLTGAIYEIPSPYTTADLPGLRFVQSNDTITFTHASRWIRELKRSTETRWTITKVAIGPSVAAPTVFGSA